MPDRASLVIIARQIAAQNGLNDALVCAVCEQESSWDANAYRYEPAFYQHYIVPLAKSMGLSDLEACDRATSWGLMQIMGQTARDFGFIGNFTDLKDPATGIKWGCRKLAQCMKRASGDAYRALEYYNGGGNKLYAGQVIARMDGYIDGLENA